MIQLHRLEGFYWVARYRGYASAARNFPYPITQPAVHQQVRKLEGDLDCRLFERIAKDEVRLTAAGRRLFDFCAPFFEELPAVVRSIESGSHGGELRIDGGGLTIRTLMPGWIRRLRRKRSDIRVVLAEQFAPDLDRLRTGAADLVVDFLPEIPPRVETREVARAHAFLAIPGDHPASKRKRVKLDQFADEAFVSYPPGTPHHRLQTEALTRFGITPKEQLSAASVDSILSFVRAGLGYSLVPWIDRAGPKMAGVLAHRQTGPGSSFPILAAWRPGPTANPLVDAALAVAPSGK